MFHHPWVCNRHVGRHHFKADLLWRPQGGTLAKADAEKEDEIRKKLTMPPLSPNTNLGDEDGISVNDTPQDTWGR